MAAQTGGYLSDEQHSAFKQYAASLNVSISCVASLLVLRELSARRLCHLKPDFDEGLPPGKRNRVTAHHRDPEQKAIFKALCKDADIAPDRAASILFRAELNEHWLRRCVGD